MKRGAERLKQFDNPEVLQRLASRGGMFTNWMNTPEGRQFDQAASQYIQNLIYAKSGKGITAEEARKLYGTYIRLPGDDAATAAAKRAAREEAEASVGIIAGRALPLVAETEARTGHGDANGARRALDPREKAEAQRNPKFQQFLASKGYGPGDWK